MSASTVRRTANLLGHALVALALLCLTALSATAARHHPSARAQQPATANESPTPRESPPPAAYSKGEMDAKLQQLQSGLISQTVSRSELDAKLADMRDYIGRLLGDSEKRAAAREVLLAKQFRAAPSGVSPVAASAPPTENAALPATAPWKGISPWAGVIVALAASVLSICIAFWQASRARIRAGKQIKRELALQLLDEWTKKNSDVVEVFGALTSPDYLLDGALYRMLIEVGNWFDKLAGLWKKGIVDEAILKEHGIDENARQFWAALVNAKQNLPKNWDGEARFSRLLSDWNNLRYLAGTPSHA